MDQTDTFQFLFLKVHFVLILPGSQKPNLRLHGLVFLQFPLIVQWGFQRNTSLNPASSGL